MERYVTVKPLPFFYVGKQISKERTTRFKDQKHNLLTQALGKPDTRSIWYSKEHFTKLLEEIDFAGGDGIRIQFGMYEAGHEFEGQTCLLFNTTREVVEGNLIKHVNVVLENEPDYLDRSSLPREIISFPGESIEIIKDFNLGSPCPPSCDDEEDDRDDDDGDGDGNGG
jgi:hypothetical protein